MFYVFYICISRSPVRLIIYLLIVRYPVNMYHRIFNFNKIIWKLGPYLSNFIIVARALASHGCKSSEFEIPYYYGLIFVFFSCSNFYACLIFIRTLLARVLILESSPMLLL